VGVEVWYANQLLEPLHQMLDDILTPLRLAFATGDNPLARDEPIDKMLKRSLDAWSNKWVRKWDGMSTGIADKFARRAWTATDNGVRASFNRAGFTLKFKPTKPMLMAYNVRVQANVDLIRTIPQQFLKDVSQQVWDAVTTGSDMNALTRNLEKSYSIATRRAAFIARDQNNKAKASFEDTRRMELGITHARWVHSTAGKEPRPTHVKAGREGVIYDLRTGWLDPADGKYKRPGEDINCRCSSKAIIPGLSREQ